MNVEALLTNNKSSTALTPYTTKMALNSTGKCQMGQTSTQTVLFFKANNLTGEYTPKLPAYFKKSPALCAVFGAKHAGCTH